MLSVTSRCVLPETSFGRKKDGCVLTARVQLQIRESGVSAIQAQFLEGADQGPLFPHVVTPDSYQVPTPAPALRGGTQRQKAGKGWQEEP